VRVMDPEEYCKIIAFLGWTTFAQIGRALNVHERTARRWADGERKVDGPLVVLLEMLKREKLEREKQQEREQGPDDARRRVHSVQSFCESNDISVSTYYALKRAGQGPREMKVNKRILISPEAERDWRRKMEQC